MVVVGSYPNRTPEGRNEEKTGRKDDREQEAAELKTEMEVEPNIQMTLQTWRADCGFNAQRTRVI